MVSKTHNHKPIKAYPDVENKIVEIVDKNPRKEYGLSLSTWSLRVLAGYVSKETNLTDATSHTGIRNTLLKHHTKRRQSKITLGNSLDPEYPLKKKRVEDSRYSLPSHSTLLLYEDEK